MGSNDIDRTPSQGTKASSLNTRLDEEAEMEKRQQKQQQQSARPSDLATTRSPSRLEEGEHEKPPATTSTTAEGGAAPLGFQGGEEVEHMRTIEADEAKQIDFPDGGRDAWLVVAGAWSCSFVSWGYVNAFGVLAEYYLRTILSDKTSSEIAWISSLQYCLIFAVGLFTVSSEEEGVG